MIRQLLIACACTALTQTAKAQLPYSIKNIPDSMKADACMVVRDKQTKLTIKNAGTAVLEERYVFTVLNPGGDKYAVFQEHYDKLRKLSDISGRLYNADGLPMRSIKTKDVRDYSNTSESSLADDSRVKVHDFSHRIYPYTVEYESTTAFDGIFSLPSWVPVMDENISVEKSALLVSVPAGYTLRYKLFNLPEPKKNSNKNQDIFEWSLSAWKAITSESYTPDMREIVPFIFLAPSKFEMQKYSGDMQNWKDFGSFIYQLNKGRDILPENVKQVVHQLADPLPGTAEKVSALYSYFQKNTRYISIQLGIGGWQTFDAGFVASNGYGDCKALSNYMGALLKEAGIKSHYTLVKSGDGNVMLAPDFSANQFDHVILCVPDNKDSIWLECTNQSIPAGYLGAFTSNRNVLLIDENGGTMARTPKYTALQNLQVRKIEAKLDEKGNLHATLHTNYAAEQQDYLHEILHNAAKEQLSQYMKSKFAIASYEVENFSHVESPKKLPVIHEEITINAKNYAAVSGKRLFIVPNVTSASGLRIKNVTTRRFDFEFRTGFLDRDTVIIQVPPGYTPETIPAETTVSSALCKYHSVSKYENGTITFIRMYEQNPGRVKASEVKALAEVFDKIYKADHAKVVLVKQATP